MAQTLLAHLYSRIRGSQEDVATYSLQYILSQSEHLNTRFNMLLANKLEIAKADLSYSCQAVGENKERPDLSGKDENGNERILCEAKFYAGLTSNQPNAYIDRLISENGSGLIFICPQARLISLWDKLTDLCKHRKVREISTNCVSVDGVRLSILSWSELLAELHQTAASFSPSSLTDIDQMIGFCAEIDNTAFIPFTDEDFGPEIARKIERYCDVIDAVVDKLKADKSLDTSTNGLKAAPFRHGYTRYIYVNNFALCVKYDRNLWRKARAETPFWMYISTKSWKHLPISAFAHISSKDKYTEEGFVEIALYAPTHATLDEVAASIKDEIVSCVKEMERFNYLFTE